MNEFLDQKDSGTAVLSHFYLLTGCAGSVWLETPTRLHHFTGILIVGIGDALASIVGKRIGIHRWSPSTSKSLEGSTGFTVSVVMSAWVLRLCGFVEPFGVGCWVCFRQSTESMLQTLRYVAVVALSAVLEALSDQNDNLTLPLFMWSVLVLSDV
jgi:dolichol kinase